MPTPVAHSILGAAWAVGVFMPTRLTLRLTWDHLRRHPWPYLFVVGLSLAPDVDYVPGLLTGSLSAFHQVTTHSITWCLLLGAGVLFLMPLKMASSKLRWGMAVLGALGIHLLADVCTVDLSQPVGIPLLWPWTDLRVNGPLLIFLNVEKDSVSAAFQVWNLKVLARELLLTLPLVWAVWFGKSRGCLNPLVEIEKIG
jgi:hypothetical protein